MAKPSSVRNTPVIIPVVLGVLGVVLIVVAIVYFTKTAHGLPSFFPGR